MKPRPRRRHRRPGLPIENPLIFYPKYAFGVLSKHFAIARMIWRIGAVRPKGFVHCDFLLQDPSGRLLAKARRSARGFREVYELHLKEEVDMRSAAMMLGMRRVADAMLTRGLFP